MKDPCLEHGAADISVLFQNVYTFTRGVLEDVIIAETG